MKRDLMDWALFAITIVAALIGIGMVIYKITGHSPTIEEVLLIFVVAIAGLLIKHMTTTSKFVGKTATDINYIKGDLHELKVDIRNLRTDVLELKKVLE